MVDRIIENRIKKFLFKGKSIIIYGARQVGKTTLIEKLLLRRTDETIWFNCDEPDVREIFSNITSTRLKAIIGKNKIVVIDEAQRVENVGLTIKLIVDKLKTVQVIASGSSSLELADKISEPLTGRKFVYQLYPFSYKEMVNHHGLLEEKRMFEHRLIYGFYPDIVNNPGEEQIRLQLLADSYLYKDILSLDLIKKPKLIDNLLRALALQLGNEVSYNELGKTIGADNQTIEKYVDLLEKCFVLFQLNSFSRNKRNEIKKGKKIYFFDNGIRNAIINNFTPINSRSDKGALFENFLVSERIKKLNNSNSTATSYFWRNTLKQEIDYIEEDTKSLNAFEFKWKLPKNLKAPLSFDNLYPNNIFSVITSGNFDDFLL